MQGLLQVVATIKLAPEAIEIAYQFENRSESAVLVFDRMWDMESNSLAGAWAYVEIRQPRALVSRAMQKKPYGLKLDEPPVPYAREVAPGAKVDGAFAVPLPLQEAGAYDSFVKRAGITEETQVTDLAFGVGWMVKPSNFPPGVKPVDVDGEKGLLLLPYEQIAPSQQLCISQPVRVNLVGVTKR